MVKKRVLSEEEKKFYIEQYIDKQKCVTDISEEFGIGRRKVYNALKILKINRENKLSIKMSNKMHGDKNPAWKGENVSLTGLHIWMKKHKPKPEYCEDCGVTKPYDLTNVSGEYKRDINDFKWKCRRCHMIEDGRLFTNKWKSKV